MRVRAAVVTAGAVVASLLAGTPAGVAVTADSPVDPVVSGIIGTAQYANARWGWIEMDAAGTVLAARNADQLFIPGSNVKLITVSAVWDRWGAGTRFVTPVHAVGRQRGSRLAGDLVLVGSGDLSLGGRVTRSGSIAWRTSTTPTRTRSRGWRS